MINSRLENLNLKELSLNEQSETSAGAAGAGIAIWLIGLATANLVLQITTSEMGGNSGGGIDFLSWEEENHT